MEKTNGLHSAIYDMLATLIELGVYRLHDQLPYIKELSEQFHLSKETVRTAYQQLKLDGYISLTQNIGARVIKQYQEEEIEQHILLFFSARKEALLDMSDSLCPLFSAIQYLSLKSVAPDTLQQLRSALESGQSPTSYQAIRIYLDSYQQLNNDMLTRLIWRVYLFFQIPFYNIRPLQEQTVKERDCFVQLLYLAETKQWDALKQTIATAHILCHQMLLQFYEDMPLMATVTPVAFTWDVYQKNDQKCYSLGVDIIKRIGRQQDAIGCFLPSLEKLAKESNVSVSTVRRTLQLLNDIGAVRSINGKGTMIISNEQIAESCDITRPVLRKRLSDFIKSLHICAITCHEVLLSSLRRMSEAQLQELLSLIQRFIDLQRYGLIPYAVLGYLADVSAYATIRAVYSKLFQQLLWGYPLQAIMKLTKEENLHLAEEAKLLYDSLQRAALVTFTDHITQLLSNDVIMVQAKFKELAIETPWMDTDIPL